MNFHSRLRQSMAILAVAGLLTGCSPFRKKAKATPKPPPPFPQETKKPEPPAPLPVPPTPEETAGQNPAMPQPPLPAPPLVTEEKLPPPAKPKGRKRRHTVTVANLPPAPQPAEASPQPAEVAPPPQPVQPPPPALQLGSVLTAQQRAEYLRAVEQHIAHANADLATVRSRTLTSDQVETVDRIESFVNQARENRDADPALAARLAQRAELLARDLISSVR